MSAHCCLLLLLRAGIALGVKNNAVFPIFLGALAFHQGFEGVLLLFLLCFPFSISLVEFIVVFVCCCCVVFGAGFALGVRISEVGLSLRAEAVLICIYVLSAPLGVFVGIAISANYNPERFAC